MKSLIVCFSFHHKNTEKIAAVFGNVLDAEVKAPGEIDLNTLAEYDLIGFGSGIAFGKHLEVLLDLADKLPTVTNKKAFIFSTSGRKENGAKHHAPLREKLQAKGYSVVGEFNCVGFDTYGALTIWGGINRGHPDEEDLKRAEDFAKRLMKTIST